MKLSLHHHEIITHQPPYHFTTIRKRMSFPYHSPIILLSCWLHISNYHSTVIGLSFHRFSEIAELADCLCKKDYTNQAVKNFKEDFVNLIPLEDHDDYPGVMKALKITVREEAEAHTPHNSSRARRRKSPRLNPKVTPRKTPVKLVKSSKKPRRSPRLNKYETPALQKVKPINFCEGVKPLENKDFVNAFQSPTGRQKRASKEGEHIDIARLEVSLNYHATIIKLSLTSHGLRYPAIIKLSCNYH